jgi:drug/metabolite transporter (DMT)-like permease
MKTELGVNRSQRMAFVVAFTAVCLIWGSTYLGVRFAIETLPPLLMAGVRFSLAGVIVFVWARLSERSVPMPTFAQYRAAAIVGALLVACCNGLFTLAMGRVPSSIGALTATSLPIWMVLLDWLRPRGVRPATGVLIGVGMGFAGIIMLVQPWNAFRHSQDTSGHIDTIGLVMMLLGTIGWAFGSIYARQVQLPRSPRMNTAVQLLAGGAILLVLALLTGEPARLHIETVSAKSLAAFFYLVFFGSIAAFTAYAWLLRNVSAALASSYTYVNPIVALTLGATLGGEQITTIMIVAMVIIMAAVAIIARYRSQNKPASEHDAKAVSSSTEQNLVADSV